MESHHASRGDSGFTVRSGYIPGYRTDGAGRMHGFDPSGQQEEASRQSSDPHITPAGQPAQKNGKIFKGGLIFICDAVY